MKQTPFFHRILYALLIVTLIGTPFVVVPTNHVVAAPSTSEFFSTSAANQSLKLDLYANIETVGVVVSGDNLPETAAFEYRQSGATEWKDGHTLMKIDDGRLVSSLFDLSADTFYEVRLSIGGVDVDNSIQTRSEEIQFAPSNILYVDASAQISGDGSITTPFKTIQEGVNEAQPGTRILVADGVYHEQVSFPSSGTEGHWIQVLAAGSNVVLDGAEKFTGDIWSAHETKANVWFTNIGENVGYVGRDQERFYNYDNLDGLLAGLGHNNVPMTEGWYLDEATSTLYVRSSDDPQNHIWQIPRFEFGFVADGHNWLWIEGFEIQFYGSDRSRGIYLKNSSHVVIRHNKIHNSHEGIRVKWNGSSDQGNYTRIEFNEIYDNPVGSWAWDAVKATSMEGAGIKIDGHIGTIVRGNEIHDIFDGIYTGLWEELYNPEIAFDTDIYDNYIHNIGDDGLEPEGACINNRFRNNIIDITHDGISLAPVTSGPTWVLYSYFTNYDHTNIQFSNEPDGISLIYHNTTWTNEDDQNAMTVYDPVHNTILRNNIFRGSRYAFEATPSGSTGNDWDYNNWYTTRDGSHFKWENVKYATVADLCSSTGLECNSYEDEPGLANPESGDFSLDETSPNVDRGVVIPGINDNFSGTAPDIGADELPQTTIQSEVKVYQVFIPLVISSAP